MTDDDRRVPLAGGWALWPWIWLRAAGFPAASVVDLAARYSATFVDQLIAREAAVAAARDRAIAAAQEHFDRADEAARKPLGKLLKLLRRGGTPAPTDEYVPGRSVLTSPEVSALLSAVAPLAADREGAEALFAEQWDWTGSNVRSRLEQPAFVEAMLWQNRAALHRIRDALARRPDDHTSRTAALAEGTLAHYVQRYAVKNDTIGFFGPVAWGQLVASDRDAAMVPHAQLLARRTVYFEHWAIDTLAEELSRSRALREHVAPRRMPSLHVASAVPEVAALLAACDGTTPARDIARRLAGDAGREAHEDIYDQLDDLAQRGLVIWRLEIPTFEVAPEHCLRTLLAATGEAGLAGIAALDELVAARDRVQRAAGDPVALDRALGELEEVFERVAGAGATRRAGETYAGRTVVYEDCRRGLELRLGPAFVARFARPLSLVLQSARWYSFAIAAQFRGKLDAIHAELCARTGAQVIPYPTFYAAAADAVDVVGEVARELSARWAAVLGIAPGETRVTRTSDQLAPAVATAFAAPHAGWAGASCHEVDLLVAARSFEAVARDATLVLGELHLATNMAMRPGVTLKECAFADALIRAHERDVPGPQTTLVIPKALASRSTTWSPSERDFDVEIGTTRSRRPRDHVLAGGELVVERAGDRLVVRTRDGRHRCDAVALFEYQLKQAAAFDLLPQQAHLPRVAIDQLVVQREQWVLHRAELPFAGERGYARFVAVRRWIQRIGLPQWVFVKLDRERKPFFVDFESPLYVEMFVRGALRSSRLVVTEMLPTMADAWLADAAGNTYTCELRLAAVDASARD